MAAVEIGDESNIKTQLNKSPSILINSKNSNYQTALMVASEKGNTNVAKLLLDNGADVNIVDPKLLTALHYATQARHVKIVQLLLMHGANVDAKSKIYLTPLMLASGANFSQLNRAPV